MKIVSRATLMNLPAGTVWSYYEKYCFRGLFIKDSHPEADFPDLIMSDLIGAVEYNSTDEFVDNCERMEQGESLHVDFEFTGRETLFDREQLFAVYEKYDVEVLIKRLQRTIE